MKRRHRPSCVVLLASVVLSLGSPESASSQGKPVDVTCLRSRCIATRSGQPDAIATDGDLAQSAYSYEIDRDALATNDLGSMSLLFHRPEIPKVRNLVEALGDTTLSVRQQTYRGAPRLLIQLERGTVKLVRDNGIAMAVSAGSFGEVVLLGTTIIVTFDPDVGVVEVLVLDGAADVRNTGRGGFVTVQAGQTTRVESGWPAELPRDASPQQLSDAVASFEVIGDLGSPMHELPLGDRAPLWPVDVPGGDQARGRANEPFIQPPGALSPFGLGIQF